MIWNVFNLFFVFLHVLKNNFYISFSIALYVSIVICKEILTNTGATDNQTYFMLS